MKTGVFRNDPRGCGKKGSFVSSKLWFPHKKANPGRNFFGFLKNKKFGTSLNDFQNQELRIPLNHICRHQHILRHFFNANFFKKVSGFHF